MRNTIKSIKILTYEEYDKLAKELTQEIFDCWMKYRDEMPGGEENEEGKSA